MENATKALLIAAAVLVAILIISFGLVIYNKSTTATDSADLTATQIQAQNEKFAKYEGENQRGSVVNALLGTVVSHNTSIESGDNVKAVEVKLDGKTIVAKTDTYISKKVDAKEFYNIRVIRGSDGCVSTIQITTVNSDDTDTDNTNTIDE